MADAKTKAAKPKAKKPAAHPKYAVMIAAALGALKERNGSSRQAILRYIVENYKVDEKTAAVQLKLALKRGVASDALKQVKGAGASGSFKINKPTPEAKPKKAKPAAKKPAAKKPAAKKVAKKPVAKKASKPKKPAPKKASKPKKSPAKKPAAKKPAAKKAAKKPAKKAAKK